MSGADLASAVFILAIVGAAAALHSLRVLFRGATRNERVERAGASPLLGRTPMEAAYWALGPLASACVALGISANAITGASLLLGLGAGALLATGHFGLAASVTALASIADALDGMVARASHTSSDAGEVFDAAVDRYVELFFLAGVALRVREDGWALGLCLAAILGSFMVSYSTAKAEALQIVAPRGAMRRAERAVVLFAGAALTPFAGAWGASGEGASRLAILPMLVAVALVALVSNVSAARRLAAVARAVRARSSTPAPGPGATSSSAREVRRASPEIG